MILSPVRVQYANGWTDDTFGLLIDARDYLKSAFPDAVFHEDEDRILVWRNAEDAGPEGSGDDGSRAVCEIVEDRGEVED